MNLIDNKKAPESWRMRSLIEVITVRYEQDEYTIYD